MRTKYLAALGVSTILFVSVSALAEGEPTDDAFEQGLQLQEQGKFADALSAFQRARAKDPTPVAALHVAECEAATGRLVHAEEHLRALVAAPIGEDAPAAFHDAQVQASVELAALSPRVPHLRIRVSPPSAEGLWVIIDGVPVDPAAKAQPVDPGTHAIAATTLDGRRASASVTAREGQSTEVALVLRSGSEEAGPLLDSGREIGTAVLVLGAVTMGVSDIALTWGAFLSSSSSRSSGRDGQGDGLIAGGGVAMAVGLIGVVAGIVLKVCNPPAKATQASVIHGAVVSTMRVPTWNTAREQPPGMPLVLPIFSAAF